MLHLLQNLSDVKAPNENDIPTGNIKSSK